MKNEKSFFFCAFFFIGSYIEVCDVLNVGMRILDILYMIKVCIIVDAAFLFQGVMWGKRSCRRL